MSRPDLFISDIHLGHRSDDRRRTLRDFLARHGRNAARLFILGDLFNAWIGRKQLAEPWVAEVADALQALTAAGVEVHFVAGNRDFYGLGALERRTGMICHKSGLSVDSFGRRAWLCHGHELFVHDRRTHMAQTITHSRPVEWLFQSLPRRLAMFLAHGYENHSRRVVTQKTRRMLSIDDAALAAVFERGHDDVVCGHTHRLEHAVYRWAGREGHLWNLGSWEHGPHFLRHASDGWHFHRLDL